MDGAEDTVGDGDLEGDVLGDELIVGTAVLFPAV